MPRRAVFVPAGGGFRASHGDSMKNKRIRATVTDPHLWIPLIVLAIGITLLAVLA